MNANPTLLQMKYTRIVKLFAQRNNLPLAKALDMFYESAEYQLVSQGVSDLHCMSDLYIVQDLEEEFGYDISTGSLHHT